MKTRTETFEVVDYSAIDELIQTEFNLPKYECVCYEEWNNYNSHQMDIDGEMDEDDLEDIEEIKKTGKTNYRLRAMLNYLAHQGKIKKAKYLIEVYW